MGTGPGDGALGFWAAKEEAWPETRIHNAAGCIDFGAKYPKAVEKLVRTGWPRWLSTASRPIGVKRSRDGSARRFIIFRDLYFKCV